MGHFPFARMPPSIHGGQLGAFPGSLCLVSLPSPSGPSPWTRFSHLPTPLPHVTAWRASESSERVSPPSFPPAFPSLAGSPVFPTEAADKMGEVACCSLPLPRSAAPQYRQRVNRFISATFCRTAPLCCSGLSAAKAVSSVTGSHEREGMRGAAFPVGLGMLQVMHPTISQPHATSWILPFSSWRLCGACGSRSRVV